MTGGVVTRAVDRLRPRLGNWRPGEHNLALATIQIVAVGQAGLRGMDYMQTRPGPVSPALRSVESAGALPFWGALFLFGAGLLMVALSGGWVAPIFVGHAVLSAAYLVLGGALLAEVPVSNLTLAVGGALAFALGLWLVLCRWQRRNWLRFWLSLGLVFAGGWYASDGLGFNFRTATGVISAGVLQIALLVGIAVYVYRDRERAE